MQLAAPPEAVHVHRNHPVDTGNCCCHNHSIQIKNSLFMLTLIESPLAPQHSAAQRSQHGTAQHITACPAQHRLAQHVTANHSVNTLCYTTEVQRQGIAPTALRLLLTCEGLTCRCILSPLASRAGTRAAVGCVWHTQVMCSGSTWFTAASTAMATSKPLSCREGLPTSRTERTPGWGWGPCCSNISGAECPWGWSCSCHTAGCNVALFWLSDVAAKTVQMDTGHALN